MVVTEERCKHDMIAAFCADCNGTAERVSQEEREFLEGLLNTGWFASRWPGSCQGPGCGKPFPEGTLITRSPGGGWLAVCCAAEETP